MKFIVKTDAPMVPKEAFKTFAEELIIALHKLGLEIEPKAGGIVWKDQKEVGNVTAWHRGKHIAVLFRYPGWDQGDTSVSLTFRPIVHGTRIAMEFVGLETPFLRGARDSLGWFADRVVAPVIDASTPERTGDWLTDRTARRPTGAAARRGYRNPTHHRPNFGAILERLALTPDDRLLEIGCGGGALLHEALKSGCTAAGIDHSLEMVKLAKEANAEAIREGRLEIKEASAEVIPFSNSAFTCAAITNVLGFLEDPVGVFGEVNRVLAPGGRMVIFSTSKEARGTIAAPEPMASRIHFYEDVEIERMALKAGFSKAQVERPDLSRFVRGSGIRKGDQETFSVPFGQLLIARKAAP
ncbi:MAG TPA: methyltransferase domain-containing protein [Nitrososphaerales archaeon]|nr:methyltransferase domain-containing protein [Nitrososphaerales archaeon]